MKIKEIVLSEEIQDKIEEVVQLLIEDYLEGKPAILALGLYYQLEAESIKQILKIQETFKD